MFSDGKKKLDSINDKTLSYSDYNKNSSGKKSDNNSTNESETLSQDPFQKAVMHIISKEYYKESQISEDLRQIVEQCIQEWDELQKSEIIKIKSQIANLMCQEIQVKSFQRNTPIFYYGDKDEQIYYILKGQVQLFIPKSQHEIWDEVDFNKKLKSSSNNSHILEEKDNFDVVVNAIQKLKGSHIDLIKQNDKLRKKYFDEDSQVSRIKKIQLLKPKQMFGEISYLLEKPRPYTAIVSEELYCVTFEPRIYRRALGEYFSFINSKTIYLNNYFSSNIRKETLYHLSILFNLEIKLHLGDYLFKEGEEGNRIYLLKQGKIEFQRRMAALSNLSKKKAELKSYQKSSIDMNHRSKDSHSIQSLSKLPKDENLDNDQDDKQKSKNKKAVSIKPFTQGQLKDDETILPNKKYKQKSTLTSMAGFDDIDQDDNIKSQTNTNLNDIKYKNVSLGVICQGEFFGFEDILISSQKNYSQNISQNRRTYSAKIISSDAIVFSIERSIFLKILQQNQALDQDVKTKALVKIQYHQQRIDSLKRFEDAKNISIYQQKVPLKDMLKEKFLSIDSRPRPQISSMNNLSKQKDLSILKINLDCISSQDLQTNTVTHSPNFIDIQQRINQKKQNGLAKNNSITIKQDKKQGDDIDSYDEYDIPKDISKGNVQFLTFHNGQFSDLQSMKQSYLDQEERIKQIKKTKHQVNISDENQLVLERIFSKTNSPSVRNFKNMLLKKSSSIAKSAFQKNFNLPNNIDDHNDTQKINQENDNRFENENKVIQNMQKNENSPNHEQKKLKLMLSKKQNLKQIESQSDITQNQQTKSINSFVEKELSYGQSTIEQSKDIDLSKSFIKLEQIINEKEKCDNEFRLMNVKHKESEYNTDINYSITFDQKNIKKPSGNIKSTEIQQITSNASLNNYDQKISINIISDNIKMEDPDHTEIHYINSSQEENDKFVTEYDQGESKQVQYKQNIQTQKLNALLTPPNIYNNMKNLIRDPFDSKQMLLKMQEIEREIGQNNESLNNSQNLQNNFKTEISVDQYQNHKQSIENSDQDIQEFKNEKKDTQNQNKVFSNKIFRRYKNSDYQLPKVQFSSCISLGDDQNIDNTQTQQDNIDTLRNNQECLVDLGKDNINNVEINQKKQLKIDKNANYRSKSHHSFGDKRKIESFSSLLPSLSNFDTESQNPTTIIHKNRYSGDRQISHKPQIRVKSIDSKKQESQGSIYFNQYLSTYNNAQNIINELKQHLNDKTSSQDVSTYINMRNQSLPQLNSVNQKEKSLESKKFKGQIYQSSKNPSPDRNIYSKNIISNSKSSLQKSKDYHCKLRSFQINFEGGNSISSNISPKLEPSIPDYKQIFSSKTSKRSDEYFKYLFSNPRTKYSVF